MGVHHLTVLRDFANYKRGDHIEDEAEVKHILEGEMRHHVVKVAADVKPETEASPNVEAFKPARTAPDAVRQTGE